MPRRRREWTEQEIQALNRLRAAGARVSEIGARLGRSPGSVRGAIERYHVPEREGEMMPCLNCARPFVPAGRFNRICPMCKASPEWHDEPDMTGGDP